MKNIKNGGTKGVKGTFKLFAAFCKDRGLISRFLKSAVETGEGVLALAPDPLFQALGKLGRPLNDLLVLDKDFQEFKKEYLSGEQGAVEKFLKDVNAEGDVVATDYISHLLVEKIRSLKGAKGSVLILDDFDRMDPEHIFRILNVLSAHMEGDEDNKFGFDHSLLLAIFETYKAFSITDMENRQNSGVILINSFQLNRLFLTTRRQSQRVFHCYLER